MPRLVGLSSRIVSMSTHVSAPVAAATWVTVRARAVSRFEAMDEPALKPNQPTQSSPAPISVKVRLLGAIAVLGYPWRAPRNSASARPATPEDMWTTVPPAKSMAPSHRG